MLGVIDEEMRAIHQIQALRQRRDAQLRDADRQAAKRLQHLRGDSAAASSQRQTDADPGGGVKLFAQRTTHDQTNPRDYMCAGKSRFDSFRHAKRIAHRSAKGHAARVVPYRCRYCQGWHIGNNIQPKASQRRPVEA